MLTKTLEKTVNNLSREVAALRSILIAVIHEKDSEGEYNPRFVKETLKVIKEKGVFEYSGKGSLLRQLRRNA
ncbi:MAG: hypothetical protein A3B13_02970 [Candidatus Liptonbacteria bacterium RIFCSPLOWO2_01_FULL_45_15]|uniref:Uncharacterized protein n=1 Tax=Candidatus Liptonbacteria bacterium RIFCSPLOWO2_01_FULL_45_15 TaxID=1798649 RepID=A0A1G2CD78_9BACT|nr:MAG: hypothetical protein A3B13_02970 [Candidatus Liptonbacteria bacterium RIFCSPLOWO2_01_FULL_45_15]